MTHMATNLNIAPLVIRRHELSGIGNLVGELGDAREYAFDGILTLSTNSADRPKLVDEL